MKLNVTLNTNSYEYPDIEVDVGPNNSIGMIIAEAARMVGISPQSVTSYVIVGVNGRS